jgi:hypothetical protein
LDKRGLRIKQSQLEELADKSRVYCRQEPSIIDVVLLKESIYVISTKPDARIPFLGKAKVISTDALRSNPILRESMSRQGISLLSSPLGFPRKLLFTYSLEHLKTKDKVRFYYALKGRDGHSGVLNSTRTIQLGRAVLLSDEETASEIEGFLKYWKCNYAVKRIFWREPDA